MSTQDANPRHVGSTVDRKFVQDLAAANGLVISPERAANLIPAVQAIIDADSQLLILEMGGLPATGLLWDVEPGRNSQ